MKTILKETLVEMAKGINPRTQNLLDKNTGTELTVDGEAIINTTIAVMSKERTDDVVLLTHKAGEFKRPNINIFGMMDYSHRVGYTDDKAKSGTYLLETDADLSYDEKKLLAPSVYADKLNLFLNKCGRKETCDTAVTKPIRTWADVSYVLVEEESFTRNTETGEIDAKKEDVLMLVDGHSASAKALLEAQLLKLRPKFSTELFAEYTKDVITHDEVILWAKASTTNENAGE
jgi:hypothetical protein